MSVKSSVKASTKNSIEYVAHPPHVKMKNVLKIKNSEEAKSEARANTKLDVESNSMWMHQKSEQLRDFGVLGAHSL